MKPHFCYGRCVSMAPSQLPTPPVGARPRILAVDDQPENIVALCAALERVPADIVTASSGKEALKALLRGEFALVILDVQMPEIDGFETAALIRQRERTREVPIVFLTAISHEQHFVTRGYGLGAADYLRKPVDPEVLRAKVAVFVQLAQARAEVIRQAELLREAEVEALRRREERRYRELADTVPLVVWTTNGEGVIDYTNSQWSMLGRPITAGDRDTYARILHPEDLDPFVHQSNAGRRMEVEWTGDYRLGPSQSGEHRWYQVRVSPVRDEHGTVQQWIGTATDIDVRRRAETSVRLLASLSAALAQAVELEHVIDAAMTAICPRFGRKCLIVIDDGRQRVAGKSGVDGEIEQGTIESLWRAAVESPSRVLVVGDSEYHVRALRARGKLLGLIASSGELGAELETTMIADLTARIAAALDASLLYREAQTERTRLADANRSKDEFLATLSHELRTPLNAVLGWVKLLRAGEVEGDGVARALEVIERNARMQVQMVADLLDVSRIVSGKLSLDMQPLDVGEVLEMAVEGVRPLATKKKVVLRFVAPTRQLAVNGDRARFHQVFGNLLSNALKFTKDRGSIEIHTRRDGTDVVISVKDDGVGIDPAFLPHIFERFRQADGSSVRRHGGLGLGLAIARHVVEQHSGTIVAESELGKGATFTVRLPLSEIPAPSIPPVPDATRATLAGLSILLLEDDADGRKLIETLLLKFGAKVKTTSSVAEAIAAMQSQTFDAVVSDVGLPERDGYSFAREIRANEAAGTHLPLLALTAYASTEDRERALAAGFDAHLVKPLEAEDLRTTLRNLIR